MILLELKNISKRFGDFTAVDHLNIKVEAGEIYGLLGANGAGKTTTMRMALGIIYPDEGEIRWKGKGYSNTLASTMGYLPEERGLYPKVRVKDQLIYLAELRGINRKVAERELADWLERFSISEYSNKRVEELSKGNQQKIQFIAAVIHRPEILILDETFSGLDPVNVELLKQVVKELRNQGVAMLFSTHRMDHVEELCEHITVLKKSATVLSGKLADIKNSYPKDTIQLVTTSPVFGIEALLGVERVEMVSDCECRIKFSGKSTPQAVLMHASSHSEIERFQIMEPSMNEIFIQAVGGEHE